MIKTVCVYNRPLHNKNKGKERKLKPKSCYHDRIVHAQDVHFALILRYIAKTIPGF